MQSRLFLNAGTTALLMLATAHATPLWAQGFAETIAPLAENGTYLPDTPRPPAAASLTTLDRLLPPAYADGFGAPAGPDRPSARAISNVMAQTEVTRSSELPALSNLGVALSQLFASHEIARSPTAAGDDPFDIPVEAGDQLGVSTPGGPVIPLQRSLFEGGSGPSDPRQQLNDVTPFFDGSTVYGSNAEREALLRKNDGSGELKTGPDGLLPIIGGRPSAGDVRADENVPLKALHGVYLLEHNRLARNISDACAAQKLDCTGDQIFHTAAKAVTLGQQKVFYEEFLPVFLGTSELESLVPNKALLDAPGLVLNEATAAALRVGHTQVPETVTAHLPGAPVESATISDCLFFGSCLEDATLDELLYGATQLAADPIDLVVTDGLRNGQLATPGSPTPIDLGATNIQRGRDHGLPTFEAVRDILGFAPKSPGSFLSPELMALYGGADVDLMVALFGEGHLEDAYLGETAAALWALQFHWLKRDPHFYTRLAPDDPMQQYLSEMSLTSLITRNTGLSESDFAGQNLLLAGNAHVVPLPASHLAVLTAIGALAAMRRRRLP